MDGSLDVGYFFTKKLLIEFLSNCIEIAKYIKIIPSLRIVPK